VSGGPSPGPRPFTASPVARRTDPRRAGVDATASSVVVLNAGLAERFEVAGAPQATQTAGSAQDAIFVMVLDLP